jgi:acetyl-CoA acetyltransferase
MVAGGFESMSNVPYVLKGARKGYGYGHSTVEVRGDFAIFASEVEKACFLIIVHQALVLF